MLLPYLLKVSLLLAVLTLAYRWLIQYETFSKINRVLLWLNVAAAWTLPLIPLANWGPTEVQREFHQALPEISRAIPAVSQTISSRNLAPILLPTDVVPAWGLAEWLLLIYGLGVAGMAGRFLFRLSRLAFALWKHPAQRLENGLILVQDEDTTSPYSFFRWIILNPAQHALPETQQILAHETEHARQGHSFDLLLAEIQRVVLWFNPFAWIHLSLVQSNLEYLADQGVLANGFAKKPYQITLLHAVLRTNEPPLTNSFAQSLLKKRIKMMNRKPSRRLAWGKYALLIATLYVSAAFVAPYQKQIVEMTPAPLQPMVSAVLPESAPVPEKAEKQVPVVEPEKESTTPVTVDSAYVPKSKWVQMKEDTMFWTIPATVTWDELSKIKQDIESLGYELSVNTLRYDPLQKFLTAIQVRIYKPSGGGCEGGREEDIYTPIKGYSGMLMKHTRSIEQLPPEPLLSRYNESYREALKFREDNALEYMEFKLMKELSSKIKGLATVFDTRKGLRKMKVGDVGIGDLDGVRKSSGNTLEILEKYRDSEFYINGTSATLKEMNEVPFDKIEKIKIAHNFKEDRFIMVFIR